MIYRKIHPWHTVAVVLAVLLITLIRLGVPFFGEGLAGSPYLLIVATAALLGDFLSGIVAIALASFFVILISNSSGIHFAPHALLELIEFLIISVLIYLLSWRNRILRSDNADLAHTAKQMKKVIERLHTEAKGKRKEIAKINNINKELENLVKQFIEDDDYWAKRWAAKTTRKKA